MCPLRRNLCPLRVENPVLLWVDRGTLALPTRPGLGFEIDRWALRRYGRRFDTRHAALDASGGDPMDIEALADLLR